MNILLFKLDLLMGRMLSICNKLFQKTSHTNPFLVYYNNKSCQNELEKSFNFSKKSQYRLNNPHCLWISYYFFGIINLYLICSRVDQSDEFIEGYFCTYIFFKVNFCLNWSHRKRNIHPQNYNWNVGFYINYNQLLLVSGYFHNQESSIACHHVCFLSIRLSSKFIIVVW
jgi:hypothetical protein